MGVRFVVLCSKVVRFVVLFSTIFRFVVLCYSGVRFGVMCSKVVRFDVPVRDLSVIFKVSLLLYSMVVSVFLKFIIMSSDNRTVRKSKPKIYNIMTIRPFPLLIYRRRLKYINLYSSGCSYICQNNLEISKEELVACLMIQLYYLSGGRGQKLVKHQSDEYLVRNYNSNSCGCKTRSFNLTKKGLLFWFILYFQHIGNIVYCVVVEISCA